MRQEHILTSKKVIVLLSLLGIIPFYFELSDYFFELNFILDNQSNFKNFSSIYGSLIISFLSGMHWQKLIFNEKTKILYLPMIPVVLIWLSFFFTSQIYFKIIIIAGLIWCLLMDLFILRSFNHLWFLKLRVIVTFMAIAPLFAIFIVQ